MKANDNAIKFTDEIYATQKDVANALHIFNVDIFWTEILKYREQHSEILPFGKIKGKKYYLVLTEGVLARINNFEKSVTDFLTFVRNVRLEHPKEAREVLLTPLLKKAAILEKSTINDSSISMLLKSLYSENVANHRPVINYLSAIDSYLNQTPDYPNEDFLGNALQKVVSGELMEFYRQKDFDNRVKMLQYRTNPDYPYAPFDLIDPTVERLMDYLGDKNNQYKSPAFAKAVIATLYLDYIKPFSERNSLVSALLGKETFANSNRFSDTFFLPFEELLLDSFYSSNAYKESKASCDMTYVVFEAMKIFEGYMEGIRGKLNEVRSIKYKQEFSILSEEENKSVETPKTEEHIEKTIEPTQLSFLEEVEEKAPTETKEEIEQESETTTPIIEEKEPVETAPHENIEEKREPETFANKEDNSDLIQPKPKIQQIQAIPKDNSQGGALEEGLSKAEIKAYVKYLLETNIELNKKQAVFLANHNTPGRYYTIQQYKKYASCVYETARTSMDKLASEGYYEKLQFKNKFVYTPVKKGK